MINLTSLSQVHALVKELDLRPSRPLGQNFLIDRNILDILIDAAELSAEDVALEIGPGLGVVTERLLEKCREVTAVEKDTRLCHYLAGRFAGVEKLRLIHGDALDLDTAVLLAGGIQEGRPGRPITRVISNLPYSVGTRILVNLVTAVAPPERIVVTVQEEVAERVVAGAGDAERAMLSAWCQAAFECRIVRKIKPTCFWPQPEVRSAILRLDRRPDSPLHGGEWPAFFDISRKAFMRRRKQMATVLSQDVELAMTRDEAVAVLGAVGADARCRPEDLDGETWYRLTRALLGRRPTS
jgi:16S rRNA (adenine1518-N6/adenine1519-N6)-dimethyltransferase